MPLYSLPMNFFGPQTPKAWITDLSSSANSGKGKLYLFLKLVCAFALSALTPSSA